jgi:hypothetical protein
MGLRALIAGTGFLMKSPKNTVAPWRDITSVLHYLVTVHSCSFGVVVDFSKHE